MQTLLMSNELQAQKFIFDYHSNKVIKHLGPVEIKQTTVKANLAKKIFKLQKSTKISYDSLSRIG